MIALALKPDGRGKIGQSISNRKFENVIFRRLNFKKITLDKFGHRQCILIPSHNSLNLFPNFIFDSYVYCRW